MHPGRAASVLALVAACSGSPPPPPPPPPAPAPTAPAAVVAAAGSPHVEVSPASVRLDGAVVASGASLDVDALSGLDRGLRALRGADREERELWVTLRPDVPTSLALSVFIVSSRAGFSDVHARSDGDWVAFRHVSVDTLALTRAYVSLSGGKARLFWHSRRDCDRVPDRTEVPLSSLASELGAHCKRLGSPCFDWLSVRADPDLPVPQLLGALAAVLPRGTSDRVRLGRTLHDPDEIPPTRICGVDDTEYFDRLPPDRIQAIVRSRAAEMKACYEAALKRNPKLTGRVNLRFVILMDGTSSEVAVTEGVGDEKMNTCVHAAIKGLVFPKKSAGGNTTVVYPIVFSPSAD